jgi:formate hydrogenlyase subunit 3/multisubunit Na+/H+ antiporter MnhD subunit
MTVVLLALVAFATGVTIRLLRRLPRLVFVFILVGSVALVVIATSVPGNPLIFFGRTLALTPAARLFIVPAVLVAAALALFGLLTFERVTDIPAMIIAHSQGAYFFWALAPFIIAVAIDSFPLAIFFWAIGLTVLMFAAHPQTEGRVGGAAQFLLIIVIAAASLLLTNRFIDLYPLTPENIDLIRSTVIFLVLGFGLLLAAFPFSIWLGPLADEIPLFSMAFLIGVAQPAGLWLLMEKMSEVKWLIDKSPLMPILLWGGVLTALLGAGLALAERRDVRLIAYLSLIPLGHTLVGLGLGTRLGLTGGVLTILSRAIGIALFAGGSSFVRHHPEQRWQRVGVMAMIGGGLVLAGIPPLFGFAARLPVYHDLGASNSTGVVLLLIASAAALLVTLRIGWQTWLSSRDADATSGELKIVPYLCAAVVLVLLIVALVVGLFPQMLAAPVIDVLGQSAYLK